MEVSELTQDEQDFEAAFEQAAAEKSKSVAKAPPTANADGEGDEQPTGDPAAADKPAVTEKIEKPPEPDTVESLQDQLKELHHKERSSASRVSVFMREANQLKGQVDGLKAQVESLTAALAKASAGKPVPAPANPDADDMLDGAPDLKAAVESRIQRAIEGSTREIREQLDAAQTKLAEVGQTAQAAAQRVEPLASREEQREVESVRGQLDKSFPAWRSDVASGEVARWIETQHTTIKSMFPGRGLADSSTVLKLFYADKGAQKAPATGNSAASDERLRQAAGIQPRSATRLSPSKDDFDGAFAEFAAKRKR